MVKLFNKKKKRHYSSFTARLGAVSSPDQLCAFGYKNGRILVVVKILGMYHVARTAVASGNPHHILGDNLPFNFVSACLMHVWHVQNDTLGRT